MTVLLTLGSTFNEVYDSIMASNIVDFALSRRNRDSLATTSVSEDGELTAVETLDLVRTFSRIKDPSRRQLALDYLKGISTDAAVE